MSTWPTGTPTKNNLDAGTDNPGSARAELVTLIDLVTQMIGALAQADGVCDLDADGKIPLARLQTGAGQGLDADTLDTYHAGNASGQIPLNNGTLNTNLLAQWARKLETARTISLSGDCSGSVSFDGSANADITVTVGNDSHTHSAGTIASLPGGSVGTNQFRAAQGTVSSTSHLGTNLTLPGGAWGFYPRVYWAPGASGEGMYATICGGVGINDAQYTNPGSSARCMITLGADSGTAYANQYYMQASPPYKIGNETWGHFLFVLRESSTGKVVAAYEAEDPPWAYNGPARHAKDSAERIQAVPHPFGSYAAQDLTALGLEIALIDLREFDLTAWRADAAKRGKESILEEVDLIVKPTGREVATKSSLPKISGFSDTVTLKSRD